MQNITGQNKTGNMAKSAFDPQKEMHVPQKRSLTWLWILVGAVAVAAVLLIVLLPKGGADDMAPAPVLYSDDGDVYLVTADGEARLGNVRVNVKSWGAMFNCVAANDNRQLYYLEDVDMDTGEGTLMRINADGSGAAEEVTDGVVTAVISPDGSNILYLTDLDGVTGELVLRTGGRDTEIMDDVSPDFMTFSENGQYFAFVEMKIGSKETRYTLYICKAGGEPVEVGDFETLTDKPFIYTELLNNGTLLYSVSVYGEDESVEIFAMCNIDGNDEVLCDSYAFTQWTGEDDFMYSDGEKLIYVDANGDETRLCRDYAGMSWLYDENGERLKDRFLIQQMRDGKDYGDELAVTLYEMDKDGNMTEIDEADKTARANAGFTWIQYKRRGVMYLCPKEGGEWGKRIEICDHAKDTCFGPDGKYFYYIEKETDEDETGTLMRYDLEKDDTEKLKKDAADLRLLDGHVYTLDEENVLYYLDEDGDDTVIAKGVANIYRVKDGIYIVCEDGDKFDIEYALYGSDDTERVAKGIDAAGLPAHQLQYVLPLPGDVREALTEMYEDAMYVMDIRNDTHLAPKDSVNNDYEKSRDLAEEYKDRQDIPQDVRFIFSDFYYGYEWLLLALDFNDLGIDDEADDCYDGMADNFTEAIEAFEAYMGMS